MFKIRKSKYRHVFCDTPKVEVSFLTAESMKNAESYLNDR